MKYIFLPTDLDNLYEKKFLVDGKSIKQEKDRINNKYLWGQRWIPPPVLNIIALSFVGRPFLEQLGPAYSFINPQEDMESVFSAIVRIR